MRTIRHSATLDYYDGPVLFEGRDRIGGNYVAVLGGSNDVDPVYAVVGVSPDKLYEFRNGKVDLRSLMIEAGSEEWFLATQNRVSGDFELEPQRSKLAASDYLPGFGYTLDPATSSDVAVLDAARRRDNLVIELKAEPPESTDDHRIRLNNLVQLLELMQKLIGHAYNATQKDRGRRQTGGLLGNEALRMDVVVPAMPGSFCMLLEGVKQSHDSKESELALSLRRVDSLFEGIGSSKPKSMIELLSHERGHLASTYMKLLEFLAKEKVGFHYTWAEPSFSCARQRSITAANARRISNSIAKSIEHESKIVTLVGRLVKADLKSGAWGLESGGRLYSGKLTHNRRLIDGLVVGRRYLFTCVEHIEVAPATSKEVHRMDLKSIEEA